jgi:hypothetical protein
MIRDEVGEVSILLSFKVIGMAIVCLFHSILWHSDHIQNLLRCCELKVVTAEEIEATSQPCSFSLVWPCGVGRHLSGLQVEVEDGHATSVLLESKRPVIAHSGLPTPVCSQI